ncbi:inorganic phosphate transporter [Lysobacter xanthus]
MLLVATLLLAAANGANDNIKGAATLVGSGVVRQRPALVIATVATGLGGIAAAVLASGLLQAFSGHGIVPSDLTTALPFLASVAMAGAATVWIATAAGLPISTTHALIGALLGAGYAFAPANVHLGVALSTMAVPLVTSPVIAFVLALLLATLVLRSRAGEPGRSAARPNPTQEQARVTVEEPATTELTVAADGTLAVIDMPGRRLRLADLAHVASAATVSFARGLNDTPKITALMAAGGIGSTRAFALVMVAMAAGGLVASQRVTRTLAYRVTRIDPAEGLAANGVTAALVLLASRFGLPVSTTHVSTGALFGLAARNGTAGSGVMRQILLAWLVTLPSAAVIAYFIAFLVR